MYLGLPMTGARGPAGGRKEVVRPGTDGQVLSAGPMVEQAVARFLAVVAALRERLPVDDGPIGLLDGSLGAVAVWLDVVAWADQIAARDSQPALLVTGARDDPGVREPAERLWPRWPVATATPVGWAWWSCRVWDRCWPWSQVCTGAADCWGSAGGRRGRRLAGAAPNQEGGVMTMPHKQGRLVELPATELASRHAKRHLAWLLEEPVADRRTRVGRRQRRRLIRTRTSHPA